MSAVPSKTAKKQPKFEVFLDVALEWRWRLLGANGEIVAQSEAYSNRGNAKRAARGLALIASGAEKAIREV